MRIAITTAFLTVATATLAPTTALALDQVQLDALTEQIEMIRSDWEVPGMAVAIVEDGKLVFAQGFGVRDVNTGEPADARTLFAIGSASKAFTAASVAMLVDDGELNWGARVTEYLPWFRMYDAYPSAEMRLRDLLCHRSGLSRGDFLWYGSGMEREEVVRRIRDLEPSTSFRSAFQYQNLMYITAGLIIEETSGLSWDDFVKQRIFAPLNMTESNTSVTDLSGLDNVATPHARIDDEIVAVDYRNIDNAAPAGSINSNVTEMANWVVMQMSEGEFEGENILSTGSMNIMHRPHMIASGFGPLNSVNTETNFTLYGLGWFLQDYRGERLVQHGGNIDGMSALVSMLPDRDLGIITLTNLNGTFATTAVQNTVLDAFLGFDDHDWSNEYLTAFNALLEQGEAAQEEFENSRVEGTNPSLPLEDYAGTYEHDLYGEVMVEFVDGALVIARGELVGDLEHWHYDTFRSIMRQPVLGRQPVTFTLGVDAAVDSVTFLGEADWMRRPTPIETDDSIELTDEDKAAYAGVYSSEALPINITIEVVDGVMKATVSGQPSLTMAPIGVDQFTLEGLPASITVKIVFQRDDAGEVTGMQLTQTPGGEFELTRNQE